jgi:30S ribosomal protein S31
VRLDIRARPEYHRREPRTGWRTISGDIMGRGDARTRKGKIFKGSYGKTRPHKVKKTAASARPSAAKSPARRGA